MNRANRFFSFLKERHSIYLAREAGKPKPWTSEPILQQYRFCNVYRELDTVTIWVRENIREPYAQHPYLWFMLCIARAINWPETLAEVEWPTEAGEWSPALLERMLERRMNNGQQTFTGAYMLTNGGRREPKSAIVARHNLGELWKDRKSCSFNSIEQFTIWLTGHFGWGKFLAYEVSTDLRHTRYLQDAPDINTWANAGPGAQRGLNRIAGRELKARVPEKQALEEMIALLALSRKEWPNNKQYPRLELRDIEHGLCEFDKYERVRLGQGRPRSRYNGV
ncbi:MAG TPA: nucleotide kinase domain-containing protein [Terriglobales bacterium]